MKFNIGDKVKYGDEIGEVMYFFNQAEYPRVKFNSVHIDFDLEGKCLQSEWEKYNESIRIEVLPKFFDAVCGDKVSFGKYVGKIDYAYEKNKTLGVTFVGVDKLIWFNYHGYCTEKLWEGYNGQLQLNLVKKFDLSALNFKVDDFVSYNGHTGRVTSNDNDIYFVQFGTLSVIFDENGECLTNTFKSYDKSHRLVKAHSPNNPLRLNDPVSYTYRKGTISSINTNGYTVQFGDDKAEFDLDGFCIDKSFYSYTEGAKLILTKSVENNPAREPSFQTTYKLGDAQVFYAKGLPTCRMYLGFEAGQETYLFHSEFMKQFSPEPLEFLAGRNFFQIAPEMYDVTKWVEKFKGTI